MISIIIPTLNEEKYLPLLLKSIVEQKFKDYEIIVADAGSNDKTLNIAKKYNCKIVSGGLPAKGRNNGAKVARGNLLFFLDADVVLPQGFLKNTVLELKTRKISFGAFILTPYPESKISLLVFNAFYNKQVVLFEKFSPHAGAAIVVKKSIFKKLNGYNETIKLAEDHDLAKRAKKITKFGFLKSTKVFVSDRRFRQDGWPNTIVKYFLCELHMALIGPIKSDILKYEFSHYENYPKNKK